MPKMRMFKPESARSPDLCAMDYIWRWFYILLIMWADDYGRGRCEIRELLGYAFPLDNVTEDELRRGLEELRIHVDTQFYEVDGRHYFYIPAWDEHQRIDKRAKSYNPPPDNQVLLSPLDWSPVEANEDATGNSRGIPWDSQGIPWDSRKDNTHFSDPPVEGVSWFDGGETCESYPQETESYAQGVSNSKSGDKNLNESLKHQVNSVDEKLPGDPVDSRGVPGGSIDTREKSPLEHRNIGTEEHRKEIYKSKSNGIPQPVDNFPPPDSSRASANAARPLCERHQGMNPGDVPPCKACQRLREKHEADLAAADAATKAARRAAINACDRCDDNGMAFDNAGFGYHCTHDKPPF